MGSICWKDCIFIFKLPPVFHGHFLPHTAFVNYMLRCVGVKLQVDPHWSYPYNTMRKFTGTNDKQLFGCTSSPLRAPTMGATGCWHGGQHAAALYQSGAVISPRSGTLQSYWSHQWHYTPLLLWHTVPRSQYKHAGLVSKGIPIMNIRLSHRWLSL